MGRFLYVLTCMGVGGGVLGILGFMLGIEWPLVMNDPSPQAPLLGFVTGPLGFIIGAVLGGWLAWRKGENPW